MKKLLLLLLILLLLISCDLQKAKEKYDQKEYVESVDLTLKYLDKKYEKNEKVKIQPKIKEEIEDKFNYIINYYESKINNGTLEEKKNAINSLCDIYYMLSKRSYTYKYTDFLSKNNDKNMIISLQNLIKDDINLSFVNKKYKDILTKIKELETLNYKIKSKYNDGSNDYLIFHKENAQYIADKYIAIADYYVAENSYEDASHNYLNAYKIYSEYETNYKNSYSNHKIYQKKYDLFMAENLFSKGLRYENESDYRKAEISFQEAINFFSLYDDQLNRIKESSENLKRNKQKADKVDAKLNYDKAKSISLGKRHVDYREALQYLKKAQSYVPNYADTEILINEYNELSMIKYNETGCSNYNYVESLFLKANNYLKNSNSRYDIDITCNASNKYYDNQSKTKVETLTEKDSLGNEYIFTKNITEYVQKLKQDVRVSVSGIYSYDQFDTLTVTNEYTEISYSGNVPNKYINEIKGIKKGETELSKEMNKKLEENIKFKISYIISELKKI